ncbi:MAG TPA: ABC transporter ATP-binding protein [Candidatus Kryptonia bacterium]|nr:ABC transporter ATP-binding protein [Candidatus Kryptonia bacterium]
MDAILQARGLTKYYRHQWNFRRICVLDRLDLQVNPGEIFGLIGPNGAGKTTTFKLIVGLLRPSAGEVTFCGAPLHAAARSAIGFLPEQPYFYDYLTVSETLDFYARLYGLPANTRRQRVAAVIERVQLAHKRDSALGTLSKGTLQRVGIAQAIMCEPRLVILDEPMSGLDPAGRRYMRELILSLQQNGATVIFSSHILPDAEALCSRVGILTQGRLREIVDLRGDTATTAYVLTVRSADADTVAVIERIGGRASPINGTQWQFLLPDSKAVSAALDAVRARNCAVESLTPAHPSLEERFLAQVGQASNLD